MGNYRFKAIELSQSRKPRNVQFSGVRPSEYFGENTFSNAAISEFLSNEVYSKLMQKVEKGKKLDSYLIDQIAGSMKAWAISKGATHYTHWFQPLTGATAEKHDSFLSFNSDGTPIEKFSGNQLIQQEPDASSLPSGGIRNTFEARGYSAWDPTSPVFIRDNTLCIPSIFVSYTGEALDYKTPLLKAINLIDKAAVEVAKYFDKNVSKVKITLGIEQEYFLVDTALYNARPDLNLTGRTVFGHASAKDQQLEDHYFGIIPERVVAFMKEFEIEAHKLGIPVKTRHNEVAPNQFECAPIFEEINLAIDHNQQLMDLLETVATRHDFIALLHEKPFDKINGSGKHNNWSLETNTGINLLSPGKDKKSNFRFLTFLSIIMKAVHEHSDLLRGCIASAGNDLRLGGNEAPPAIISAFVGSHLTKMFDAIEQNRNISKSLKSDSPEISINIPKIPEILLDNTDRNRTSPFAFTGNKFEFRAVGSSANCSAAMIVLNTIVADQMKKFKVEVDTFISKGIKKEEAIYKTVRKYIIESKPIRFEGNNYSREWIEEAKKRGLSNINNTPEALKSYISEKTMNLFERNQILSSKELHARYEIQLEKFTKKLQIESRVIGDLTRNHIIPTVISYQNILISNIKGLRDIFDEKLFAKYAENQLKSLEEISEHLKVIQESLAKMLEHRKIANKQDSAVEKAWAYMELVRPHFDCIRYHIDKLELKVDNELWPLPKYRELLFTH